MQPTIPPSLEAKCTAPWQPTIVLLPQTLHEAADGGIQAAHDAKRLQRQKESIMYVINATGDEPRQQRGW